VRLFKIISRDGNDLARAGAVWSVSGVLERVAGFYSNHDVSDR
jgi:hypothetical protein